MALQQEAPGKITQLTSRLFQRQNPELHLISLGKNPTEKSDLEMIKAEAKKNRALASSGQIPYSLAPRRIGAIVACRIEDAAGSFVELVEETSDVAQALWEFPAGVIDILVAPRIREVNARIEDAGGWRVIIGKTIIGNTFAETRDL